MGGFIVGFDADQPNIFERQFQFIQEAGILAAMVGLLMALSTAIISAGWPPRWRDKPLEAGGAMPQSRANPPGRGGPAGLGIAMFEERKNLPKNMAAREPAQRSNDPMEKGIT
jgi:hypothetical protein